jgi:hypothetical protein
MNKNSDIAGNCGHIYDLMERHDVSFANWKISTSRHMDMVELLPPRVSSPINIIVTMVLVSHKV